MGIKPTLRGDPAIHSEILANMSVNASWSSNDVWIVGEDVPYVPAEIIGRNDNSSKLVVKLKNGSAKVMFYIFMVWVFSA